MSRTQLFKFKKFVMIYAAAAVFIMSIAILVISAKAGTEAPAYITAEYNGNPIVVDSSIDRENLRVCAVYADGTILEVSNYTLSTEVVQKEGANEISVIYLGKTTSFTVMGKLVNEIFPYYTGELVSIGNAVDARNVSVYVSFSDESFEQVYSFSILNPDITEAGEQQVTVEFGGKTADFTVVGQEPKELKRLDVTYTGDEVMLGNLINRDEIYVTASYADGSVESIINYDISTDTPTMLGVNVIVISYDNKTTTFMLEGIPRTIDSLSAEYHGQPIEIGMEVRKADITVVATYSDGVSEVVTDFDLPSPKIYFVGSHVKTVHYMGLTADIYVTGVEEAETSYDNAAVFEASNPFRSATIRIALPSGVDPSLVQFSNLKRVAVSKALTREVRRTNFVVFHIDASRIDDELPLEMKIKIPEGMRPEDCVLYYTPDLTTTIGTMQYEYTEDGEMTLLFYKSGNYILTTETRIRRYFKEK